jgi:uncharacterized repeat protein (TIGR03803 family)
MAGQRQIAVSNCDTDLQVGKFRCMLAILFATTIFASLATQGQTFQLIHDFSGGRDGASPAAGLTMDRAGKIYGSDAAAGAGGNGVVFELTHSPSGWVLSPLNIFNQRGGGAAPNSRLVLGPDGNLYGTTAAGGQGDCDEGGACGVVFKLQRPPTACVSFLCYWTQIVLYRFTGGSDGGTPDSEVIFDSAGNLYGVTAYGGTGSCAGGAGCGVVYELSPSGGGWTETVIHNFTSGNDGSFPSGLVSDANGNLYGLTEYGGSSNMGVLYELTPSGGGWTETIPHNFQTSDGSYPAGTLVMDRTGSLYGVATGGSLGFGAVFELSQPGTWSYAAIYSFTASDLPVGSLAIDNAGNLYGVTDQGGAFGYGIVYKLTPGGGSWVQTDLHDFNGSDGLYANGPLAIDAGGNILGTSGAGGSFFTVCDLGCGTAWEITP